MDLEVEKVGGRCGARRGSDQFSSGNGWRCRRCRPCSSSQELQSSAALLLPGGPLSTSLDQRLPGSSSPELIQRRYRFMNWFANFRYRWKDKINTGEGWETAVVQTFHNPSLASMTNSIFEFIGTCLTSGSELKCVLRLWSPNALATASWPFTRGTSPVSKPYTI